jgi:hypothetical protein
MGRSIHTTTGDLSVDGILLREKPIYSFDFILMTAPPDVHPITKGAFVPANFD